LDNERLFQLTVHGSLGNVGNRSIQAVYRIEATLTHGKGIIYPTEDQVILVKLWAGNLVEEHENLCEANDRALYEFENRHSYKLSLRFRE
jgi:hypothetical protein